MKLSKRLDLKMKSLNENREIEWKKTRTKFCYTLPAIQSYVNGQSYNHVHDILRLFDGWDNFRFSTKETKRNC